MKFLEYLNESSYKKDISLEDAARKFYEYCKNSDIDKPYWRGMKDSKDSLLLDGTLGKRSSRDTGNYYNILIDEFSDSSFPKRLSSIICTNYNGKSYAERWSHFHRGELYAVFPYDTSKIACTNNIDMWYVNCKIGKYEANMESWNKSFAEYGLSDKTYKEFITSIKENMQNKTLSDIFLDDESNIENYIKDAYSTSSLNFTSGTSKDFNPSAERSELWIGGNCILVKESKLKEFKDIVISL